MPVNSTHRDYDANFATWLRARDVFAGEDADMLGTSLPSYAKNVVSEVIGVGRAGTLFVA